MSALSGSEVRALEECESIIERGLASFIEVGEALLRVRDQRLYRSTHKTFQGYCRERWGWSRRYVNYQIQAAVVVRNLGTGVPIPETEKQARALAQLPPEEQRRIAASFAGKLPPARDLEQMIQKEARKRGVEFPKEPELPEEPEESEEKRQRRGQFDEEVARNEAYFAKVVAFIRAIEAISSPRISLKKLGKEIRKMDTPDKDWCGRTIIAKRNLEQLIKEMES